MPHASTSIGLAAAQTSARYGLTSLVRAERGDDISGCIEHEKRIKRWRRQFKFDLIEHGNPDWQDMFDLLV